MSFRHDWVLFLLVIQLLFWIFLYFKKDSQRSALSKTNDEVYSFLVRKINLSSIIIKNRLVFLGLFSNYCCFWSPDRYESSASGKEGS